MELAYKLLTRAEIDAQLGALPGWAIEGDLLARTFTFETYKDGVVFAAAVGFIADNLDHHPDISLGYAKVKVSVNTHSVGGLSPYDLELARRIDLLGA